ncbi:MAG: hypothetical protein KGK07_15255, partial [Chloroflexota bacterium]|nr:hypothetical protein [Chloroflexota bacterium]
SKKWYEAARPIDADCRRAWAACVEAFDGDQSAASSALYKIRGGRLVVGAPAAPAAPSAPSPPRGARSGGRGAAVRDPRIPPVGTTIYKKDRHGKTLAEAVVREDGIEYAGTAYKSPSAAGLAASIAIGGAKTAVDGYAFWGLK